MHHYHRLQDKLGRHPIGAPKSDEFLEILKLLFLEDEVEVALRLDFTLKTAADVTGESGMHEADVSKKLETMADRGVILAKKVKGTAAYALLPNYPGLFEYPIMKGMEPAVQKRLAELWHAYYMKDMAAELASASPPWIRIFPAEGALEEEVVEILPYEIASRMMTSATDIALARCPCRIVEGNCEKPLEVCLSFDGAARFLGERGMARSITIQEAKEVLQTAEQAGLVHTGSNVADKLVFLCNCCPCCCHMLMLLTKHGYEKAIASSGYRVELEEEACSGCGVCAAERCPVGALEMTEDRARADAARCIGCGLCVTTCPTGALKMVKREQHVSPPASARELAQQVMAGKKRKE